MSLEAVLVPTDLQEQLPAVSVPPGVVIKPVDSRTTMGRINSCRFNRAIACCFNAARSRINACRLTRLIVSITVVNVDYCVSLYLTASIVHCTVLS